MKLLINLVIIISIILQQGCKTENKNGQNEYNYESVPDSCYNIPLKYRNYDHFTFKNSFEIKRIPFMDTLYKELFRLKQTSKRTDFEFFSSGWNYMIWSIYKSSNYDSAKRETNYNANCFYLKWKYDVMKYNGIIDTSTIYTNLPNSVVLKLYPNHKGRIVSEKLDSLVIDLELFKNINDAIHKTYENGIVDLYGDTEARQIDSIVFIDNDINNLAHPRSLEELFGRKKNSNK